MLTKLYQLIIFCLGCILLAWGVAPTAAYAQGTNEIIGATFADLNLDDIELNGLYSTGSLWIPFQSDWLLDEDIEIELTYRASPLINSRAAILTVFANNQEVTSFRPVGDGREHTQSFAIPPALWQAQGVNLTFAGYLRLTDDPCEESFNIGQWLIIRNNSRVNFNLAETLPPPELTDLPQALVVQGSDTPPPIVFVLPEEADDVTLTTAIQVAARLGKGITFSHLPIRVVTADTLTQEDKENANLILIGIPDNQPLIAEMSDQMPVPPTSRGFVSEDGVVIPSGDGVVQIFPSPWQPRHHVLLVSGNDTAGLAMAGQAFVNQDTFQLLTGSFHFIHSTVSLPESAQKHPWLTAQTTFAQLGESDRQIIGLGLTNSFYFFQYPPGVILDEDAQMVLHLAFSSALRTQGSYVEVSVNDIYVGAVDPARVGGDSWVSFDLPVQVLNQIAQGNRAREIKIQLSIANLLPINNCEQVNAESSWTKIYADSYFQFNYLPVELPDLYYFPYPFASLDNNTPIRIAIPADPSREELQTVLSLAALIGNQATTDLEINVISGSEATPESLADRQLILIGTPADNPLLQEMVTQTQSVLPDDVYQVLNTSRAGFFHALTSPWDEEMSALAIYGETDAGFEAAAEALYQQGQLVSESGSIALIRSGEEEPVVIYREVGLPQPQVMQPDIVLSEISQQGNVVVEPTATSSATPEANIASTETGDEETTGQLSNTERLILIITALLVMLVAVAAIIRNAWRIRA